MIEKKDLREIEDKLKIITFQLSIILGVLIAIAIMI